MDFNKYVCVSACMFVRYSFTLQLYFVFEECGNNYTITHKIFLSRIKSTIPSGYEKTQNSRKRSSKQKLVSYSNDIKIRPAVGISITYFMKLCTRVIFASSPACDVITCSRKAFVTHVTKNL